MLLAAAVAVGVLIKALLPAPRSRQTAGTEWTSRAAEAYVQGVALYDAIDVAVLQGAELGTDGRWAAIRRRADGLTRMLYALSDDAPTEEDRLHVNDALAALRSVVSEQARTVSAGRFQADSVQSRLRIFESTLRALHTPTRRLG